MAIIRTMIVDGKKRSQENLSKPFGASRMSEDRLSLANAAAAEWFDPSGRQRQASLGHAEAQRDAFADVLIVFLALEAKGDSADAETQRRSIAGISSSDVRTHFAAQRLTAFQRNPQGDLLPRDPSVPRLR